MEQAAKVVEFAKANGFPNADLYLYSHDAEVSFDTPDLAMDDTEDGGTAEFDICISLSNVKFRQEPKFEDGDHYSNAVEVSP